MARFSCGSLAHGQLMNDLAHFVENWQLLPEELADCLGLTKAHCLDDKDDQELRRNLVEGLNGLVDPAAGRYREGVSRDDFVDVLSNADLQGLMTANKRDPRAQQIVCLTDIKEGFQVAQRCDFIVKKNLGIVPDDTIQQWIRRPSEQFHGMSPLSVMRLGAPGTDAVARLTYGTLEPAERLEFSKRARGLEETGMNAFKLTPALEHS